LTRTLTVASLARLASTKKFLGAIVSISLTIAVFYLVLSKVDVSTLSSLIAAFPAERLLTVSGFLLIGAALSAWRLQLIAKDLGYRLTALDAIATLGWSQIVGSLFFQILGQLAARGALLARRGMPVAATVTLTVYERAAAAAVSLLLAIGGGWYVFGRITLDIQQGGLSFLKIIAGLLIATTAGAWLAWGAKALSAGRRTLNIEAARSIARNVVVSFFIQSATMAAYVVAANTVAPTVALTDLGAASAVVMLAASLPISLAGWGIRELSAVFALGAIGVSPQGALTVALLIGVISLLVVGLFATASFRKQSATAAVTPVAVKAATDYGLLLASSVPLLAATAVYFQLYIPVGQGRLSVNLADPLAVLGGALFVIGCVTQRRWPQWRLSHLNLHIILVTLALAAGLLYGAASFGWTAWAVTNRFLGWFILLGYGATGALLVRADRREGLRLILRTFAAVAASIVVIEMFLVILAQLGIDIPRDVLLPRIAGFSQNPNGFSFQLVLALCAIFVADFPERTAVVLLTACFVGLWFAASRSLILALPAVFGLALYTRVLPVRRIAVSFMLFAGVLTAIALLPALVGKPIFGNIFQQFSEVASKSSDSERMASLLGGLHLFLSHPIFGAGLGAFMEQHLREFGTPLVIHSTPLWLLAEFGIVGFLVFLAPAVRIFLAEIVRARHGDLAAPIPVLLLAVLGTMGQVHELLYQRGFWLLIGAALACTSVVLKANPPAST